MNNTNSHDFTIIAGKMSRKRFVQPREDDITGCTVSSGHIALLEGKRLQHKKKYLF